MNKENSTHAQSFNIIGITDSRELTFTKEEEALIARSHVFSGGKRHHEIVAELLPKDCSLF